MNSSSSAGPSLSNISAKKSSISISNNKKDQTTSTDTIPYVDDVQLQRKSSSGFNYQTLEESSPIPTCKNKSKPPVRSHSSNNAELSFHLQQLKNFGKRKTTLDEIAHHQNDERIHLTSSNLKVECDEHGVETTIHTTMEMKTIEASIDLPSNWKAPAPQTAVIERDSWDHKVEFLLAVIGYAVDLGKKISTTFKKNFIDQRF